MSIESLARRFWKKAEASSPNGCWEWTACKDNHGYGRIGYDGMPVGAHRVAWILTRGPIPAGMSVLHACDNPACINPLHLFLGTRADNIADMVSKGRHRSGIGRGSAKFTAEKVRAIRLDVERGATNKSEVARRHGVSRTHIG